MFVDKASHQHKNLNVNNGRLNPGMTFHYKEKDGNWLHGQHNLLIVPQNAPVVNWSLLVTARGVMLRATRWMALVRCMQFPFSVVRIDMPVKPPNSCAFEKNLVKVEELNRHY